MMLIFNVSKEKWRGSTAENPTVFFFKTMKRVLVLQANIGCGVD